MTRPTPPAARKAQHRIEQLGRVRDDPYAWLKDENWQEVLRDPTRLRADIREHLEAENAYCDAWLEPTRALQAAMFEEMKGRIQADDASPPDPDGPFVYGWRYAAGAQHPLYVRRPRAGGAEEILLDSDAEARGKAFFKLAAAGHSPDHAFFAYAADEQGSEVHRIFVRELSTGEVLPAPIESAAGGFCWSPDSRHIFWIWRNDNGRPARVYRRPVRGGPEDDVLVYEEPDEGFFLSVSTTDSRAFILISAGDHETSEVWSIPGEDPTAAPSVVEPRTPGLRYEVEHWDGRFFILTNADGAVDNKIVTADPASPGRAGWREWRAHVPGVYIVGLVARRNWLVRLVRQDALNRIVVTRREGGEEHEIAFDEAAYALTLTGSGEHDSDLIRFTYESPATPRQWFDYDLVSRARSLVKSQVIPSGHDPAEYEVRRLTARASDGAEVPITALMRRGTALDGSAPLLLYGYGSYGIPMEPTFSIRNLSLVNRGWIWAVAHIRGGTEKGWGWFLDGRGAQKMNTFTDFIACAETLVDAGMGSAGRIVAYGGSAGGMLMGAVANLRPDLFAGVIAAVPFVDVLNTMSDESLPLTPAEWPEWGNPIEDPEAYDRIAAYSPYDNVAPRAYPAILATGGLSDPRVTYWEPAKWIARLRDETTGEAPLLLRINMEAGHGGASGRFDFLKEIALDYAFAVWAVERGWRRA